MFNRKRIYTSLSNDELIKKIKMINKIPEKGYMIGYNKIDRFIE